MNFITREWLLAELPLRKMERAISRHLHKSGFAAVLECVLRKGRVPTDDIGIVDIDVDLGKFFVHEMEKDYFYLEAVYTGVLDVDVRVRKDEHEFESYTTKSFMLDIEATVEIDVEGRKIVSFEVIDADVF